MNKNIMNKNNTNPYDTNEHSLHMVELQGKGKTDFVETEFQFGKSIFDYIVDNSMYVNKNECNNYTPPFITYMPSGIPIMNIDMENKLKGMNQESNIKYESPDTSLVQTDLLTQPQKKNVFKGECEMAYKILPRDYI